MLLLLPTCILHSDAAAEQLKIDTVAVQVDLLDVPPLVDSEQADATPNYHPSVTVPAAQSAHAEHVPGDPLHLHDVMDLFCLDSQYLASFPRNIS